MLKRINFYYANLLKEIKKIPDPKFAHRKADETVIEIFEELKLECVIKHYRDIIERETS